MSTLHYYLHLIFQDRCYSKRLCVYKGWVSEGGRKEGNEGGLLCFHHLLDVYKWKEKEVKSVHSLHHPHHLHFPHHPLFTFSSTLFSQALSLPSPSPSSTPFPSSSTYTLIFLLPTDSPSTRTSSSGPQEPSQTTGVRNVLWRDSETSLT